MDVEKPHLAFIAKDGKLIYTRMYWFQFSKKAFLFDVYISGYGVFA